MLRILIADDHDVVRAGLRSVLEARAEWIVVGEARDGKEAIQLANQTKPDIAIIDYGLPVINGIEVIRQIKARHAQAEVLMFTMHDDEALIAQALEAGARAYLLKTDARVHLLTAVEQLAAHKPFFTGQISETLLNSFLSNRRDRTQGCAGAARTHRRAADRRGPQQPRDQRDPSREHQDRGGPASLRDEEAAAHLHRSARALRHPQQIHTTLKEDEWRIANGWRSVYFFQFPFAPRQGFREQETAGPE